MDSIFKLYKEGCSLIVHGLEEETGEYYIEAEGTAPSFKQYKYTESITLNIVQKITLDNKGEYNYALSYYDIVPHDNRVDQSRFSLKEDGLYQVSHIIIPTELYSNIDEYDYAIYYDSENNTFKEYKTGEEIPLKIIIEINNENSTIVRSDQNTFNTCYLQECVFWKLKEQLNSNWVRCNNTTVNRNNYDLLWMTLYVIKYLEEFNQFNEALRVYNKIMLCGNLCNNKQYIPDGSMGCGCSN